MIASATGDIINQTPDNEMLTNAAARAAEAGVWKNSAIYVYPPEDAPATLNIDH